MCCPFADATSFASGWLLVSTFYNQFLDSDQPSDSIACKRRPGHVPHLHMNKLNAMYMSFADVDEQGLQETISSGSRLHGMMDLFEDTHLFCMYW